MKSRKEHDKNYQSHKHKIIFLSKQAFVEKNIFMLTTYVILEVFFVIFVIFNAIYAENLRL